MYQDLDQRCSIRLERCSGGTDPVCITQVIPSFYVMPAICIVLGIGDYFTLESLILAVSNTVCLVCEHYECLTIFDV